MQLSRLFRLSLAVSASALAFGLVSVAQGRTYDRHYDRHADRTMEQRILAKMHDVNQMEISMGNLAMQKGESRQVRDFGRRVRNDHRSNDRDVMRIARREHIDLTQSASMEDRMSGRDRRTMDNLNNASGRDFDRTFLRAMAEGHSDVERQLVNARDRLSGGPVRSLVTSTIPAIRRHERMARNLENRI